MDEDEKPNVGELAGILTTYYIHTLCNPKIVYGSIAEFQKRYNIFVQILDGKLKQKDFADFLKLDFKEGLEEILDILKSKQISSESLQKVAERVEGMKKIVEASYEKLIMAIDESKPTLNVLIEQHKKSIFS